MPKKRTKRDRKRTTAHRSKQLKGLATSMSDSAVSGNSSPASTKAKSATNSKPQEVSKNIQTESIETVMGYSISLVRKDLFKTAAITVVLTISLIGIYLYMR